MQVTALWPRLSMLSESARGLLQITVRNASGKRFSSRRKITQVESCIKLMQHNAIHRLVTPGCVRAKADAI
jgi:hypothetical protein